MDSGWDAVIVGGGAAGLSAAQMLGRSRRRVLVVDAGSPRNRFAEQVHGVLGHDGVAPSSLLELGRDEARKYGVEFVQGEVERLSDESDRIRVEHVGSRVDTARAVVLASGVRDELLDVPGLSQEWGRGVLHCPYCHGWEVAGRRLAVLATSPVNLHQAQLVRQLSDDVTVFTATIEPLDDQTAARLVARGIHLVQDPVRMVRRSDDHLLLTTADGTEHPLDALFTGGAPVLDLGYADAFGLRRADGPGRPIEVDPVGRTSHPRIFAAGNTVAPFGNVPVSMGSGSTAGAGVNAVLTEEDVNRAISGRAVLRNAAWEQRYVERGRFWNGQVNAVVAAVVADLEPGTALDVGSGEGGDAVWLAEHGWRATGVEVSPTAIARSTALARERGVDVEFVLGDGAAGIDGLFTLVLASFLHSEEPDFPRISLLRDAAARVAPDGRLLVLSHVTTPWRTRNPSGHSHPPVLRLPQEELAQLALDPSEWRTELVETRHRQVEMPGGVAETAEDGVLLLHRLAHS
jgi:thioredoxin reductase